MSKKARKSFFRKSKSDYERTKLSVITKNLISRASSLIIWKKNFFQSHFWNFNRNFSQPRKNKKENFKIYLSNSNISGLSQTRCFILSCIAVMTDCALSSAPCFELFSAAPAKHTKINGVICQSSKGRKEQTFYD